MCSMVVGPQNHIIWGFGPILSLRCRVSILEILKGFKQIPSWTPCSRPPQPQSLLGEPSVTPPLDYRHDSVHETKQRIPTGSKYPVFKDPGPKSH